MRQSLYAGALAGVVGTIAAPLIKRWLIGTDFVDVPNHRSSHAQPVPRGGGLACAIGCAAGFAAIGPRSQISARTLVGVAVLPAMGWADDRLGGLSPILRLGGQVVAGALMTPSLPLAPFAMTATSGIVNAVNFMDGINGITATTMTVFGLTSLAIGREDRTAAPQTLGAITTAVSLSFLPHNFPKGSMFLGDVGSYLFGGLAAASIATAPSFVRRAQTLAPLTLYLADTGSTLVRRARLGEALAEGHRDHVYQRLVDDIGLSHVAVTTAHGACDVAIAYLWLRSPLRISLSGTVAVVVAYLTSPRWLNPVRRITR